MERKLSASVVGGGMGGRLSLDALLASDQFEVLAAADLRADVREALEKSYPGIRTYESHQQMFAETPSDVVCVSTFPPSHNPVTLEALQMPSLKGLLVEKPLGDTAASGRSILDAVMKRGVPMVVPHGLRVRSTPVEILGRIRSGEIGDVKLIEVQCDKWDLINAGIHWLDFCLAATGDRSVRSVMCACDTSTRTFRDGMQVETEAITYVVNEDGVRFVVQTGDYVDINSEGSATLFRIIGTEGLIEMRAWQSPYRVVNAQQSGGKIFSPAEFKETGHQRHLEELARQIFQNAADYTLPQSSQAALEICEAAFLAQKHRCKVHFPLADFVPPPESDWECGKPYAGSGGGRDGRNLE